MIGKPDAIVSPEEQKTGPVHAARVYRQHRRLAVTLTDAAGRVRIGRQMHLLPVSGLQAFGENRVKIPACRAVIKQQGWLACGKTKIDGDRVTLRGANPAAIVREREPLLVAFGHDRVQRIKIDLLACRVRLRQQFSHVRPAARIKLEADRLRRVAQHIGQEFADFFGHCCFLTSLQTVLRPPAFPLHSLPVVTRSAMWGRLREGAKSYAKALANDILR